MQRNGSILDMGVVALYHFGFLRLGKVELIKIEIKIKIKIKIKILASWINM